MKTNDTSRKRCPTPLILFEPNAIYFAESFTYDGLGRPLMAAKVVDDEPVSASVFSYNALGLVTSETQSLFGATAKTVSYGYDQYGYRTSTTYPDGTTTITRTNTPTGQIDTLSRGQTQLAAYDYLGTRTARRTYNTTTPVEADYGYDSLGRLTAIDAGAAADFEYAYVANKNNIWKKTFGHRSGSPYNEYSYDDIDRLTGVTYLDSDTEGFVMDDLGNRDGDQTLRDDGTVNFAVDTETNRYTSVGGNSLAYDAAGNLTTDKDGYQFTYDEENRMRTITASDGAAVARFDYDTQGRRIRVYDAIAGTITLYYYSDNWQVLAEYDDSDVLQTYYMYGNYIDEALLMSCRGSDYYYIHDHLNSPVALTYSSGSVVERYEYDAYGKATILDSNFEIRASSIFNNHFLFTGRWLDTMDSGSLTIYDYRHRSYDPITGRFMQKDPLGINPAGEIQNRFDVLSQYIDDMGLYEYVGSNPVWYYDPYGLISWKLAFRAGLQMLAGAFEMSFAGTLLVAPEPLSKVGGVVIGTMGINTFYAGMHNMVAAFSNAPSREIQGPIQVIARASVMYVTKGNKESAETAVMAVNTVSIVCDCISVVGTISNGVKLLTTSEIATKTGVYEKLILNDSGVGYDVWQMSIRYVGFTEKMAGASVMTIDATSTAYSIYGSSQDVGEYYYQKTVTVEVKKTIGEQD